jgi:hypothetical protein
MKANSRRLQGVSVKAYNRLRNRNTMSVNPPGGVNLRPVTDPLRGDAKGPR